MTNKSCEETPESALPIAIVGAGMAGLTLANLLLERGFSIQVFEKSRGTGGRMASRAPGAKTAAANESTQIPLDIGAQYFTARDERFQQFLSRFKDAGHVSGWEANLRYVDSDGHWSEFQGSERFVGVPRMSSLTRQLRKDIDVRFGHRITEMHVDKGAWWLSTDSDSQGTDHAFGPFRAVLLTAPAPQCKDLIDSIRGTESPLLPVATTQYLAQIGMRPGWTVALHFPEGAGLDYDGVQTRSDVFEWCVNNSSKPGRRPEQSSADSAGTSTPVDEWWVLQASAAWSESHLDCSGEFVLSSLTEQFRRLTGCRATVDASLYHLWRYARPKHSSVDHCHWIEEAGIGLAGDWLTGGRVEGAFLSGFALAEAVCHTHMRAFSE